MSRTIMSKMRSGAEQEKAVAQASGNGGGEQKMDDSRNEFDKKFGQAIYICSDEYTEDYEIAKEWRIDNRFDKNTQEMEKDKSQDEKKNNPQEIKKNENDKSQQINKNKKGKSQESTTPVFSYEEKMKEYKQMNELRKKYSNKNTQEMEKHNSQDERKYNPQEIKINKNDKPQDIDKYIKGKSQEITTPVTPTKFGQAIHICWDEYMEDYEIVKEWRIDNRFDKNTQEMEKDKSQDETKDYPQEMEKHKSQDEKKDNPQEMNKNKKGKSQESTTSVFSYEEKIKEYKQMIELRKKYSNRNTQEMEKHNSQDERKYNPQEIKINKNDKPQDIDKYIKGKSQEITTPVTPTKFGQAIHICWDEYMEDYEIVKEWRIDNRFDKNTQEMEKAQSQDEKQNNPQEIKKNENDKSQQINQNIKDQSQERTTPVVCWEEKMKDYKQMNEMRKKYSNKNTQEMKKDKSQGEKKDNPQEIKNNENDKSQEINQNIKDQSQESTAPVVCWEEKKKDYKQMNELRKKYSNKNTQEMEKDKSQDEKKDNPQEMNKNKKGKSQERTSTVLSFEEKMKIYKQIKEMRKKYSNKNTQEMDRDKSQDERKDNPQEIEKDKSLDEKKDNPQEMEKDKSQDEKKDKPQEMNKNKKGKSQEITTPVTPMPTLMTYRKSRGSFLDQQQNFKSMASFIDNLDLSTVSDRRDLEYLLEILEKHWKTITIDEDFDCTDENYEGSNTLHEQMFVNIKKKINSKLWPVSRIRILRDQHDVPIFNGHHQHWASFKEVFTRDIHNNSDFTADEKMQILIGKIKGEPERLVQHLSISVENYEICWNILNDHYSNKNLILSTYMNILMNIPKVQVVTPNSIKRVLNVAIYCISEIKNAGIDTDNWDSILVHMITQKLDPKSVKEYQASLEQPRELPSLDNFLKFMSERCAKMESAR